MANDFEITLADLTPEAVERLEKWAGQTVDKLFCTWPEHTVLASFDFDSYHGFDKEDDSNPPH